MLLPSVRCGTASWTSLMAAFTFTSKILSMTLSDCSTIGPTAGLTAALDTRMSSLPNAWRIPALEPQKMVVSPVFAMRREGAPITHGGGVHPYRNGASYECLALLRISNVANAAFHV